MIVMSIKYSKNITDDIFVECGNCHQKSFEVFQCECGHTFCKKCEPQAIEQEDDSDTIEVTCQKCKTKTLFV